MDFLHKITRSLSMQGRAIGFIMANNLAWTLLIPVAVFIVLGVFGMVSVGAVAQTLLDSFFRPSSFEEWGFYLVSFAAIIFRIIFLVLFWLWGGYIVVIVMSPFMAYVSEKSENILTGNDYPFDLFQVLKDALRGILLAIRNCFMEMLIGLLILVGMFVPIVGPIVSSLAGTVFLFFVSAYYYGFSFMDYTNERRKLSVGESVNFLKSNKGTAVGHGLVFALLQYVPVVGVFLSAIFAIISTVAATIEMVEGK